MSETLSAEYVATAPALVGVWTYDPNDVAGTERNFIYAQGRSETLSSNVTVVPTVGRRRPILEYGENFTEQLSLTVPIPFSPTHDAEVKYWRDRVEAQATIVYRDNRKRLWWVGLDQGIQISDERGGTAVMLKLTRLDPS